MFGITGTIGVLGDHLLCDQHFNRRFGLAPAEVMEDEKHEWLRPSSDITLSFSRTFIEELRDCQRKSSPRLPHAIAVPEEA